MVSKNKKMTVKDLTFVHSLFYAGSTYFYNALKRTGKFHIYHEPMHEIIASLESSRDDLAGREEVLKSTLRHNFLEGGYFDEFSELLPRIQQIFDTTFSFDYYFLSASDTAPDLKAYIDLLKEGASKLPILQCTRTSGRIDWLKHNYESNHIFLLRNPWDQWYSYKVDPYIANTPRVIYSQSNTPAPLKDVFMASGACPLFGDNLQEKLAYAFAHPLTPEQDYFLFFGLWVHSFVCGRQDCDVFIDMDDLSASVDYRTQCLNNLKKIGIDSVIFSDANLHQTVFDSREEADFRKAEEQILEIFQKHGALIESISEYLEKTRQDAFVSNKKIRPPASEILEDAYRMRKLLSARDGQIASLSQTISERDAQIANLNQAITERNAQVANLTQVVTERDGQIVLVRHELLEACKRVQTIEMSRSWRMTAPYRWIGTSLKASVHGAARTGVISRLIVAILLLPAAIVFHGGLAGLLGRLHSEHSTFAEVIAGQDVIWKRLQSQNRFVRRLVFAGFSLAVRIQRAGSVKRSLSNFFRIIRTEGFGGIRARMITTVQGMATVPASVNKSEGDLPVLAKEVSRRVLVADYRVPRPDVSAGELATFGILRDLCAFGYEVVFLPNDMMSSPHYEADLQTIGIQVVTRESGFDNSVHYLEKHGSKFGVFYLIRVDVAETLLPIARRVAPNSRIFFHAPDLYFLRELRKAELYNDQTARRCALQMRDRELAVMNRSDLVVLISPAEALVLREVAPDTPISIFPGLYVPIISNPRPFSYRKNIFFLGGFGHQPNVNAVLWFVAEVWPHVHQSLPDIQFQIIGAEVPDSVLALGNLPGIKVIGFVPDLSPVLENLRIGVAPLQYGAGIKGKVAFTMGAGIPCVCTEIAAEGMGIKNDVHALVENDPVRFAQAIVDLYQDEKRWSRLAKNGQILVQENFSTTANRASLLKVLDQAQALPIPLFIDYLSTACYCQTANPIAVPNPYTDAEVDVSIIIPVYNKWDLTRSCLTSVVQTSAGSGVVYEIILADDGSTDETVRATEIFPGLRVIKTPKNLGFLRNCNNAAKHARGRYLLLLNNDTIVLPGWLQSLYKTIESDSSIAIAGSKLLYPDGSIQEAGAVLFSDGTAINIGRGFSRFSEIFNLQREVDYISGASILIRKSFWDSRGGFDERFDTAYCEDCDLAMSARSMGMRVIYEPSSEVIHFEHQSYTEQTSSHHLTLQNHNTAILCEKWSTTLKQHHLRVCDWHLAAANAERSRSTGAKRRHREGKFNILFFTPFPSHPANHGSHVRIQYLAKRFQTMGHKVHFSLLQSKMYTKEHEQAMRTAWDTFDILPNSHPLGANGQPIPFDGWYEEGLGERIRVLCAKYDIDIVFCSYIFQSKILEYVPSYILKIIDTHDKMGDRYEMLRKNSQPLEFFSCTPEEEGTYLRRADIVVAMREEEALYFDSVTGRNTSIIIPHIEEPHFFNRNFTVLKKVGVVASANHINLSILGKFLKTIDNKLTSNDCPFTIHVAGQVKDMIDILPIKERAIFKRPWVQMHGFVQDITQFYAHMDIVVSPVTMGTGINIKTVEAMAFGMPILTTKNGSKGIETDDPMHNHSDLDALVDSLLNLANHQEEVARLAALSRERYISFFESGLKSIQQMFAHSKLTDL